MRGLPIGAVTAIALVAAAGGPIGAQQQAPAAPAAAAHAPAPAPGDAFDYRTSHGRVLRMALVERSADRFVWELSDVTGPPRHAARITQDDRFRVLVHEDAAGGVTRYEPHNCEKVVGICSYTVHHPDGSAGAEMRINGVAAGVWNYSLWREAGAERRPLGIGEICYDAAGLSLSESWTDLETAAGYSVERIMPDGSLADCSEAVDPLQ